MATKEIVAASLKGLEVDNDGHPMAAPAFATGRMKLAWDDSAPEVVLEWRMEFDCPTTKSKFWQYNARFHEEMRAALKENGIEAI